jgi:hypothetical protein
MRIFSVTLLAVATMAIAIGFVACKGDESDCSCAPGAAGLVLHANAGEIASIALSGDACSDAPMRCVPMDVSSTFTAGCAEYQILPNRGGSCTVHVESVSGAAFDTSATMIDTGGGCCGGVKSTGNSDVSVTFVTPADAAP